MKTFWHRITLECYRHPDDTEKLTFPRFAQGLFVVAVLVATCWVGEGAGF